MAIIVKSLACNVLDMVDKIIYTAPTSPAKTAIVKTIRLVNKHTAAVTVNVRLVPSGGTARLISPKDKSMAANELYLDDKEVTLGSGDAIQVSASITSPPVVEYVLSGVERDA